MILYEYVCIVREGTGNRSAHTATCNTRIITHSCLYVIYTKRTI